MPAHRRVHRRAWGMAVAGAGAAVAVVVAVVLLVTLGSTNGPATPPQPGASSTSSSLAGNAGGSGTVPAIAATAEHGMVVVEATESGRNLEGCGVAVAEGGLVATTADTVQGATSVTATPPGGRPERATVLAVDRGSDIALLRIPDDLPVPGFDAGDAGLPVGHSALVVALTLRNRSPVPAWAVDRVDAVGATVVGGSANGLAAIAATLPSVPDMGGDVLVDSRTGSVAGMLDKSGTTAGIDADAFLPSGLVVGVASELASTGRVAHGWLDIVGSDAPGSGRSGPAGAAVVRVEPGGASVSLLRTGDVIVAVGGEPVRSMAQLRVSLYLLPPGTPVHLTVDRGGTPMDVAVSLSASP